MKEGRQVGREGDRQPDRDGLFTVIGVNISEQKSGTERSKKRELVFFTPPGGAIGTVVHRLDAKRIFPELR